MKDRTADGNDIAVLVVDDQDPFRSALRDLIGSAEGFTLVGEACSGEEAAQAVAELSPQLVLMDVFMPGMGGIAAAHLMLTARNAPVVVLISVDDPSEFPQARTLNGLVDFVRKQDLRPRRLSELWQSRRN